MKQEMENSLAVISIVHFSSISAPPPAISYKINHQAAVCWTSIIDTIMTKQKSLFPINELDAMFSFSWFKIYGSPNVRWIYCLFLKLKNVTLFMMVGKLSIEKNFFSVLRTRTLKKRTVIFGLKSDHYSREILLQLLTVIAKPGDNVLAVHVEEQNDTLDLNTFHIHEDLCRSKKVSVKWK